VLDVLHGHALVRGAGVRAFRRQLLEGRVVVVALPDRFLEDARVGGNAAQVVPRDHLLELPVVQDLAADVVQPDGLAERMKLVKRILVLRHSDLRR
jgi:hypothetical protein